MSLPVPSTRRDRAIEVTAVVLLALAALWSVQLAYAGGGDRTSAGLVWAVTGLQLAATAALVLLGRRPVPVAVAVAAVVVAGLVPALVSDSTLVARFTGVNLWPPLALSTAVIGLRRQAPERRALAFWVLVLASTVLAARPWHPTWLVTPIGLLHTAVPALLGLYLVARWQMVHALRERAEHAEREQLLLADRARAQERNRLASELHDSVAHRVNLMVLQAGALRLTSTDPATRNAAETLRATGCQALEELSDLLGMLRPGETGTEEPAGVSSDDLATLVADSRAVGLPVILDEAGDPGLASPLVRRTVYRVVQEALTNVHKHASGARVTVTTRYRADRVDVAVHNAAGTGAHADLPGTGTGLPGLRRRVETIGGSLSAGAADDGGFRLDATMPSHVTAGDG
ncbi:MAG TPA: histidine kinase [Actinocatenispora sp.]